MAAEATSPHVTRKGAKLLGVFASLKKFDKFVGVSSEITAINRQALSRYVRADAKFIAAPNPISPQRITEWAQRPLYSANPALSLAAADDRFYKFCCVGRLSPEKGQLRLIRAFSGLISRGHKALLIIVGDGPSRAKLQAEARRLRISDFILFAGRLANPYPIIAASDCLILPSDYEGQGIVLLEAMALGKPCIGSDVPAVSGLLRPAGGRLASCNSDSLEATMLDQMLSEHTPPNFDAEAYVQSTMKTFVNEIITP